MPREPTAPTVPAVDADAPSFPGGQVGRYLLMREIGRGAMGQVFAGFDPDLGRKVAVKLVADDRHVLADYLLREARMLAALSHPHIVPVFDVGEDGDRVFIVMELVDGVSLATWLEETRSVRDVVRAWCAAGRGLAAAHAAGVVHRDFKASNVLISKDGHVRVADFGLARPPDEGEPQNPIEGTRGYMAPEAFERGAATEAVDQYAFCVSLHHALTGRYPAGDIAKVGARMPRRIRRVIARGLELEPSQRWASMTELVDQLERAVRLPRAVWITAVATLVLGLGSAGWWAIDRARAGPGCEVAGEVIERELPRVRRTRLAHAIEISTVPNAAAISANVSRLLDTGLAAWGAAYAKSCSSLARNACLTAQITELGMLVEDASAEHGEGLLELPILISTWTGAVGVCSSGPPAPNESRTYRHEMARTLVLRRLGRSKEALAAADRAVTAARDPRARVRAKIRRIYALEAPEPVTFDALFAEAAVLSDPELSAEVASAAAQSCLSMATLACATTWIDRLALTIAGLTEDQGGSARADLAGLRGELAQREGNHAIAIPLFQEEARRTEALSGANSFDLLPALSALSASLIDLKRYDEAGVAAARAEQIVVHWLGPDHPERATALNELSLVKLKQGKIDEAITGLERVIALRIPIEGEHSPRMAGIYNNLAVAYQLQGKLGPALALIDRSIALYAKNKDMDKGREVATVRNGAMLAGVLGRTDARTRIDAAHALASQRVPADHPDWATLHQTLGSIALRSGDLPTADKALREAITRYTKLGDRAQGDRAVTEGFMALLAMRTGDTSTAARALDRAKQLGAVFPASSLKRAWLVELDAELAIARSKDGVARAQLDSLAALVAGPSAAVDPRFVSHYHLLRAELATRAKDVALATTERELAAVALRATEIPEEAGYQDCAVCRPPAR